MIKATPQAIFSIYVIYSRVDVRTFVRTVLHSASRPQLTPVVYNYKSCIMF